MKCEICGVETPIKSLVFQFRERPPETGTASCEGDTFIWNDPAQEVDLGDRNLVIGNPNRLPDPGPEGPPTEWGGMREPGDWHLACEPCAGKGLPGELGFCSFWAYYIDVEDYCRDREDWDRHLRSGKAWWTEHVDRSFDAALERAGGEELARKIAQEEPKS